MYKMATDNADLYKIIQQLTERVNRLEKMVQSNPIVDAPSTSLSEWIDTCNVVAEDVEMVYENNGYANAIRNCVRRNHTNIPMPIMIYKNALYVYESNKWEKWSNLTHMHVFTRDLWRKFVKLHMQTIPDQSLEDEMYDLQRKRILEMRQKLYEVKKNRMELYRWLMKIDS
jgi:hypothetical protein